jgi:hypothetical protein
MWTPASMLGRRIFGSPIFDLSTDPGCIDNCQRRAYGKISNRLSTTATITERSNL